MSNDESGERFAAPKWFAGYRLHDPLGQKIGKVEKLFVNGDGGPEYVAVKMGVIWRKKTVLIPVEFATADDDLRILALG